MNSDILIKMSRVIVLTGPAAAGKNTIANMLARKREKGADIDVDLVRWMYRQPHKAPWEGEEGMAQLKLGAENACLIAKSFISLGIDVVISDVLTDETAKVYKELLPDVKIILLTPVFDEAHKRFTSRAHTISEDEFRWVYDLEQKLTIYDEKIDNTSLSPEETVEKLLIYMR